MQISDKLGQYNRNLANGTEELRGVQSAQKMVSTVGDLSAGSVFEGTVNHVRGGKVTLALGNGQVLTARLEGKVDIKPGTAMFFQVKSNDGLTVSIRPYNEGGNITNPILLNALTAAQIPATDRTLMMVDAMMQEHMSVDRQSILNMVKILSANPKANVQTIVQMTKLGLPVTEEMATQFEHYLSDQHSLMNEMELAVGQIAELLGDESITSEESFALYDKIVNVLLAGDAETIPQQNIRELSQLQDAAEDVIFQTIEKSTEKSTEQSTGQSQEFALLHEAEAKMTLTDGLEKHAVILDENGNPVIVSERKEAEAAQMNGAGERNFGMTLGDLLTEEQLTSLSNSLKAVPVLTENTELFTAWPEEEVLVDTIQDETMEMQEPLETVEQQPREMVLNRDLTASDFLRALQKTFTEKSQFEFEGMQKLFAGKEFQLLLRDAAEQQWLVRPRELTEDDKLDKLYEKLERQISQLENVMKTAGITQNSFLQTASDIRGNIEFMNQMNQIYHYVQIPLKMSGQKANGELYVYSNRKKLDDPDAELTAFLHLDMEHLGSTDVSVRMLKRQVKTNFYFEDDRSYDIVEKHLPILEKRLKNKGYHCTITITNEKKEINFKENFVKKGSVLSGGSLHRYSFDVRA